MLFLRFRRLRRQGRRPDHADRLAQAARRARVAQLQGPAPGMAHDLARPAAGPPAKGLDAHRLAARVQRLAHQREQVEREHAQRGMLYWFNTYETFQAASALCLKFSLYACMGAACPSA